MGSHQGIRLGGQVGRAERGGGGERPRQKGQDPGKERQGAQLAPPPLAEWQDPGCGSRPAGGVWVLMHVAPPAPPALCPASAPLLPSSRLALTSLAPYIRGVEQLCDALWVRNRGPNRTASLCASVTAQITWRAQCCFSSRPRKAAKPEK